MFIMSILQKETKRRQEGRKGRQKIKKVGGKKTREAWRQFLSSLLVWDIKLECNQEEGGEL